ncbi:hypothetical protein [Actinomyces provencensis]|uniref:hypothetical protein n=1 Tax=Actinomyces provencensis TaxID=1720198 RepID=UPI00096AAE4F|nr:hypothetical protein [Actinomyces provencensis]
MPAPAGLIFVKRERFRVEPVFARDRCHLSVGVERCRLQEDGVEVFGVEVVGEVQQFWNVAVVYESPAFIEVGGAGNGVFVFASELGAGVVGDLGALLTLVWVIGGLGGWGGGLRG